MLEEVKKMLQNRPKSLKTIEIAKSTGVSKSNINKIEAGTNENPAFKAVVALHKFLSSKGIKTDV
jgi:transcriptional regulator with XRE-family HTH domain